MKPYDIGDESGPMGRAANHLTVAQFDLLRWVAAGCEDGVYEGTSHRVSARSLHNRGFLRVSGNGATWAAQMTPAGTKLLNEEAERLEAERERLRKEEQARAEREREQQDLRARAAELLRDVIAAGGRFDLGETADPQEVQGMLTRVGKAGVLPEGQRLAQEPTRMDPVLGVTVYLEPDFESLTAVRSVSVVPRQLRGPHPAVAAFQSKKALVSKGLMGRAARFLQGLVLAAEEVGWKVSSRTANTSRGRDDSAPDLTIRLPSREVVVVVRELDQRGRRVRPYVSETDYYARTERIVSNKHFQASGDLEVTITQAWQEQTVLALRDTGGATLEEQLPVLIRKLEIAEAEAVWLRREEARRSEIRKLRWEEVKNEAFRSLTYQRNAEQLRDQLERRQAAAAMRAYADEVEERCEQSEGPETEDALKWVAWIRQHADRTDPVNGPQRPLRITSASHDDLAPHMNDWSTHGPYRR